MIVRTCVVSMGILLFCIAPGFSSEGLWTENGVVVCNQGSPQYSPAISSDGAGNAIIVWQDWRSGSDIYAQKIDGDGNTKWAEQGVVICNQGSTQYYPAIRSDGSGGAIIVWQDARSGNDDIYAQRIDGDGNTKWAEQGVVVCDQVSGQTYPAISPDGSGGAIVVWQDARSGRDIYAQRIDGDGNTKWAEQGVVVCNQGSTQYYPAISSDGSGNAIIVWQDGLSGRDIYAQRIDNDGNTKWAEQGVVVCNQGSDQSSPAISSDGSGGAIIVWEDARSGRDIYAQKIEGNGNTKWAEQGIVVGDTGGMPTKPAIAPDNSGGGIVVWKKVSSIFAQRIDNDGSCKWSEQGVAVCSNDSYNPAIASDNTGGGIIAWQRSSDIYAQRIIRPRPKITSVSPDQGAWGCLAKDITIYGSSFHDDRGEVTYAKLTNTVGDYIEGQNLRDMSADAFTCDFDLSSLSSGGSWYVVVYDSLGQTGTCSSELFNVCQPEMQGLSWTSAQAGYINTGTQDNPVGQLNCAVMGYDYLHSLSVENLGTAEPGTDILALGLWHKTGGSSQGMTFDPLTALRLGTLSQIGTKVWTIGFGDEDVRVEDGDALYITVDIQGGAQAGRTCRFSLPVAGAQFKYKGNLPASGLISAAEQMIARSASFQLDFFSLAPVNALQSQKAVSLGQIRLDNVTGKSINISSITINLMDMAGTTQNLGTVFNRIWIEQGGIRRAELRAPFGTNRLSLTEAVTLGGQQEAVWDLAGDISAAPAVKAFRVGLFDGQCINNGTHLAEPTGGKAFPLLSGQVNIRAPETKAVFSNYPNPFQPGLEKTKISYYLRQPGRVKIKISSISRKLVKVLADGERGAGIHETEWDGRNENGYTVISGIYLLRIEIRYADGSREKMTRKVAVVK